MRVPRSGRVSHAGRYPTVRARIISATGVEKVVEKITSAPDDHFAPGPDCGVITSPGGGISNAGRYPTICARIVFAAGVERKTGRIAR